MERTHSLQGSAALENQPKYKRKIILINKGFQLKLAVIIAALFSLAAFMVWWEVYQIFNKLSKLGMFSDPQVMSTVIHISQTVLIKVAISQILVIFLGILLSHFIAGPVYHIEKSLGHIKNGDFTHRIHLRKHDQLTGVADTFNSSMESLQAALQQDRNKLDAAIKALEKMNSPKLNDIILELKQINKSFTI